MNKAILRQPSESCFFFFFLKNSTVKKTYIPLRKKQNACSCSVSNSLMLSGDEGRSVEDADNFLNPSAAPFLLIKQDLYVNQKANVLGISFLQPPSLHHQSICLSSQKKLFFE